MIKILIICGPTATGKTALAAKLAKRFSGEIISADSRQVYQGMDIVTGKDKPRGVKIHGLDLVKPNEAFSVAHFVTYARSLINQISFPIIVGGSGLYLNSLINPPATLTVPPNWTLRNQLEKKSVLRLQQQLRKINPERLRQMNQSDKSNPRRLIRAIEVSSRLQGENLQVIKYDVCWIGLTAAKKILDRRIAKRVQARLKKGAVQEWRKLKNKYGSELPAMSAIGYAQLPKVEQWILAEQQYARRQQTWFKKNKKIHWWDITRKNWQQPVVKLVDSWYTKK